MNKLNNGMHFPGGMYHLLHSRFMLPLPSKLSRTQSYGQQVKYASYMSSADATMANIYYSGLLWQFLLQASNFMHLCGIADSRSIFLPVFFVAEIRKASR